MVAKIGDYKMTKRFIKHLNPVWQEKSNFIIKAKCSIEGKENLHVEEQIWSRQLSDVVFEVCCIPFFIYNLALGDKVHVDGKYLITDVIESSGYYTFRVWFNSVNPSIRDEVTTFVNENEFLSEWYSRNLLAISASSERTASVLSGFLLEKERIGGLVYETGKQ
jgi:hypothetical protein